jgi:hypothetical protein
LTDRELPGFYQAADQTSLEGQRRYLRAIRVVLAGSVVAAAGGAVASSGDNWRWLAFLSGAAFLLTILASLYIAVARPAKVWYDGRAAAESAKSLAWEYAVGGGPFCLETCPDPDEHLLIRLGDILKLRDFTIKDQKGPTEQITEAMRVLRGSSLDQRRSAYLSGRIEDQRSWYSKKARWNQTRSNAWLVVSLVAQGLGVAGAFLLGAGWIGFDALGLFAAVAAAIAAWVQAKDHAGLASAYGIASQELGLAKIRLAADSDELTWASLVDDAEQAISREHTLWLARRGSAGQVS